MKCPLCGFEFEEKDVERVCKGCPLAGLCNMVKCPNCGYETPGETGLLKAFKALRSRENGTTGRKG